MPLNQIKNQLTYLIQIIRAQIYGSWPRGVMVKAMDCKIVESEFESRYYVHFRTNTLGKGMNPLNLSSMG